MAREAFVVRYSRTELAGFFAISIGFVVAGLAGLGLFGENPFPREPGPLGRALVYAATGFFAVCAVVISRRLFRSAETYRFDTNGVTFEGQHFVAWEHIRKAEKSTQRIPTKSLFPVHLHYLIFDIHPEFEKRLPASLSFLRSWNYKLTGGSHVITAMGSELSLDQIISGYNKYAPGHLKVQLD